MGLVRLNVTDGITPRLRRLRSELEDVSGLWERLSEIMVEETVELWATEGAAATPPWAPLSEYTIQKKMRMGIPLDPMVETRNLYESLTDPTEAMEVSQGHSSLGTFTSKEFTWGTEVVNERGETYAEFHQEGPDHNPKLPVRNVVNVTPHLLMRIDEAAEDWIKEAIREVGLS